jgi:hypothetical protein
VVTTWQITFEQIQKGRQSAANLLLFMSFFNPRGIPVWVLQNYQSKRGMKLGATSSGEIKYDSGDAETDEDELDQEEFDEDMEVLRGCSLVVATTQKNVYEVHPLVQLCTRVWLSSFGEIRKWRYKYLQVMSREYPRGKYENRIKCQQLNPHIETILDIELGDNKVAKSLAELLHNAGWYKQASGKYQEVEQVFERILDINSKVLGKEHPATIINR